jgi:benzoylformate decarboxylase
MFQDRPTDFRHVLGLVESVAVAMADSYAQVTRREGAGTLHSAGGVGHALAAFTAYRNQTPMVIIAGQQTRAMPDGTVSCARSAIEFRVPT